MSVLSFFVPNGHKSTLLAKNPEAQKTATFIFLYKKKGYLCGNSQKELSKLLTHKTSKKMKKAISTVIVLALISTLMVSCGSLGKMQKSEPREEQADMGGYVKIQKSRIQALAMAQKTGEIRAYGTAESLDEMLALNTATAQATAALQAKIQVYVESGLKHYNEQVKAAGGIELDQMTRNQVTTAVKDIVEGVDVVDYEGFFNPNTRTYKYEVCVKYDRAGIMSIMKEHSARIKANEKQFEHDMQDAWDLLDAENGRPTSSERNSNN
jgi:hypothetical protein